MRRPRPARSTCERLESVLVVGTGLIGTSIALALREQDVVVYLADRDAGAVRLARELGAGHRVADGLTADIAVIAVPPAVGRRPARRAPAAGAGPLLHRRGQRQGASAAAGREPRLRHDHYVAGHPLAGRERSGPAAARADLFLGRPWALCPTEETSPDAVEALYGLIKLCGGEAVGVDAAEHDRAVAIVSHAPHVTAAARGRPARRGAGDRARPGRAGGP